MSSCKQSQRHLYPLKSLFHVSQKGPLVFAHTKPTYDEFFYRAMLEQSAVMRQ